MKKLPPKLSNYSKEYFALLSWAHNELTEKDKADGTYRDMVSIRATNGTSNNASRLLFEINQLRKSLRFWAPSSELTEQSEALLFKAEGEYLAIRLRFKRVNLINVDDLPDFENFMETVKVPATEKTDEEAKKELDSSYTEIPGIDKDKEKEVNIALASATSSDYIEKVLGHELDTI